MKLTVLTGRANSVLAEAVVSSLGIEPAIPGHPIKPLK
jgi:hypothetical protein